jgi:hypothetical protein
MILRRIFLNNSGAARAYGCLSTSFSRLERDTRRRGVLFLYRDSNALTLNKQLKKLYKDLIMIYSNSFS